MEAETLPSEQLLAEMGKFNEELSKAGVSLAGEGPQASSKGARVKFAGTKRTVIDGPFAETKELVAGFGLWKCASLREAIEWVKRCPNPIPDGEAEIEIRQVFEAEDFGPALTPELREQEERLRSHVEQRTARETVNQEKVMKYLCLIYQDESIRQKLPKAEFEKIHGEYLAFTDDLKKSGRLLGNHGLQPTQAATTVRVRDGKITTTDGPFAETKEQLGGYYLIEARDLNDAIQVAAKIPSARFGSIEVRPVWI